MAVKGEWLQAWLLEQNDLPLKSPWRPELLLYGPFDALYAVVYLSLHTLEATEEHRNGMLSILYFTGDHVLLLKTNARKGLVVALHVPTCCHCPSFILWLNSENFSLQIWLKDSNAHKV